MSYFYNQLCRLFFLILYVKNNCLYYSQDYNKEAVIHASAMRSLRSLQTDNNNSGNLKFLNVGKGKTSETHSSCEQIQRDSVWTLLKQLSFSSA